MARKSKVSAKVRHEVIRLVLEDGLSVEAAAKKKGLGKSTVGKYLSDYRKAGNKITMKDDEDETTETTSNGKTPLQSELQELRNKVKKLKAEKEVLKKTISIMMADD